MLPGQVGSRVREQGRRGRRRRAAGPRTQAERSRETRQELVAAARLLFAERGYAGVAAAEVAGRAGLTTGALYHHFRDKRDLFRAAFDGAEEALARRVAAAAAPGRDPWERLCLGVDAYLCICREPELHRLVLVDGPSVLGWEEWRSRDAAHHLRPLRAALAAAMRAGLLERRPPEPLARLLLGALGEAGRAASAGDEDEPGAALVWVLERLRQRPPAAGG